MTVIEILKYYEVYEGALLEPHNREEKLAVLAQAIEALNKGEAKDYLDNMDLSLASPQEIEWFNKIAEEMYERAVRMLSPKGDENGLLTDTMPLNDICTKYGVPYTTQGLLCIEKLCKAQQALTRREGQERVKRIFKWVEQELWFFIDDIEGAKFEEFKKQEGL